MPRLQLRHRSSINRKTFSLDDEIEDAPLLKVEFCNEFFERIPPDVRLKVAKDMLQYGLRRLNEEAEQAADDRPRYDPAEGF